MSPNAPSAQHEPPAPTSGARERILDTAYELFSRYGIRAVGVDAIIQQSGVARMTLYRHFASKDALVLAFLERREQRWTQEWLQHEVEHRAVDPSERLLAVFDVFDEWFQRDDFEGCSFINVLLEITDPQSQLHRASAGYLAKIRAFVEELAAEAGVADPSALAHKWHILMKGSIVAAGEGDHSAARRAQEVAALVLGDALRRSAAPHHRGDRATRPDDAL
jgi:AcrR family transcriptional regulator